MYKLKLIRGKSYTGNGVQATEARPVITVPYTATKDALLASGYFATIGADEASEEKARIPKKVEESGKNGDAKKEAVKQKSDESQEWDSGDVEKMTLSQLKDYARRMNMDVNGLTTKAAYIKAIREAESLFPDYD